jgi:uncharacterized protein (DUF2141 family)
MEYFRRFLVVLFGLCALFGLNHCGRRGTPSGGPKDITPPALEKTEPPNESINFESRRIRLYFDEYIRLQDPQNQIIISPPPKTPPEITPMGGVQKYVQIDLKDTLQENTTYTYNFGQSIVDNNEGNPNNFLTYVFSTGDYIDTLTLGGVVADAFERNADPFISVMLYEIDSAFTDSVIYKQPPYYITNTLDSAVTFSLNNLKAGSYRLIALRDVGKNNVFDQGVDKIGFVPDTIVVPTDSIYLLRLFNEIQDYNVLPPSFAATNKIIFGYNGEDPPEISLLTQLPDSVRTLITKARDKDTLNLWITPYEADSLIFVLKHPRLESRLDTFNLKPVKSAKDSMLYSWDPSSGLNFTDTVFLNANLPLLELDTTKFTLLNKDSLKVALVPKLDTITNRVHLDFPRNPNEVYFLEVLPGALTDFFGDMNDTLRTRWNTGSPADYGNLRFSVQGNLEFPLIVELLDNRESLVRKKYVQEYKEIQFRSLTPGNYRIRIIFDANENGKWDTGNYLKKIQPERVLYYPGTIEMRANWEKVETFMISE